MAFVDHYPPGAPCWFELGTTDLRAAKSFYTQLFGWSVQDFPTGPTEYYSMFRLKDRDAGAAYGLGPKMIEQGIPPHWNVYFAVTSADETAARVKESGGTVLQPPFDVMDVGRMSICKDPGGAVFSLWQPKRHTGAGIIAEENAVCWTELVSWDVPAVRKFYEGLFGWHTKGSANMPTYVEFSAGGMPRGGLLPMDEQWKGIPSHWGIYVLVADCDAVVDKAKELGAKVMYGPFDAPGVGRMAALDDPQGAGFSVIKLANPM